MMWIQELNIKNFGRFSNKRIELKPGINLIYGENESGKSTLHTFIRGCLFGIKKLRGRAAKTDVFNRYQPWENPAYYAGFIRFVCQEKVFRLERDFAKNAKGGTLICETDGEVLSLEEGDLQMLLGNIGEVSFDNTVSIGQLKCETDDALAIELENYMANMEGTGSAAIRVEKAIALLKEKKKQLGKRLDRVTELEEERLRGIVNRLEFFEEELEKNRQLLGKVEVQLELLKREEAQELAEKNSKKKFAAEKQKSLLGRFFSWLKRLFEKLFGRKENSYEEDAVLAEERSAKERYQQKQVLFGKKEQLESLIEEKTTQIDNCKQVIQMQWEKPQTEEKRRLTEEIEACELAMLRIQDVVKKMQSSAGQFLRRRTSEIFSEITKGRYTKVTIQDGLKLGVHTKDHFVSIEQLSRGTIWQLYFALRMAANEVLCQEERLPVILDDAFVMYDEGRLAQVLDWLADQKKQVILFTCQKREKEYLMRARIPFHEVCLMR